MKTGTGGDVKNALGATFLEQLDEEVSLALVARVPIDELIPLVDKAFDVFLLVMVRVTDLDRILAEIL
tara:strand:+ start:2459 stop:2662 length:204 start_codon:yes stop_codon:yes gene_type:complete